jgi:glycosyltransferase involved in cell wall biosynthesis
VTRISVIIPAFNAVRFIAEALQSVAEQTVAPNEVIVVDDGSTDGTGALAAGFHGVSLITTPNRGVSAARNTAVEAASGDVLAFLDADDTWVATKLELQRDALERERDLGMAFCHLLFRLEGSAPRWMRSVDLENPTAALIPSAWMIRSDVWRRVGPLDETLRSSEDVDWIARAQDMGITKTILPEVLLYRRVHDANLSENVVQQTLITALRSSVARKRAGEARP